jgi:hypothetical protein
MRWANSGTYSTATRKPIKWNKNPKSTKKLDTAAKAVNTVRVVMDSVTTLSAGPATQINCIRAPRGLDPISTSFIYTKSIQQVNPPTGIFPVFVERAEVGPLGCGVWGG